MLGIPRNAIQGFPNIHPGPLGQGRTARTKHPTNERA